MSQENKSKEGTLGKDLLQNSSGSIIFDNNDLVVTIGSQGVMQRLMNKLKSYVYSLFAQPLWGGFFQSLVSQNITSSMLGEIRTAGIQEFLEEPEVLEVKNFIVTPYPQIHLVQTEAQIQFVTDIDLETIKTTLNVEF